MRELMLILHFIGLAMGLGTSFAFMFLGISASKMQEDESKKFSLNILVLSRMGHIGLTLLILSGIYLMTPYWEVLANTPLLIIKLILVVILTVIIGILSSAGRKAKAGEFEKNIKTISTFGKVSLLIALLITVFAVLIFK